MGLFKSKEERKLERDMEIRKGINELKRNVRGLEKHEKDYLKKAKRAKQIGALDQLAFIKKTIKQTAAQRRALVRQLLAIETAAQRKNQMEAHGQFAKSLGAVAKSIAEVFGDVNWTETNKNFERAMAQAETFEQQVDVFLEASSETMFNEGAYSDDLVSDDEIDKLIEDEVAHDESKAVDAEIDRGLGEIEKELRPEAGAG
ncbi:MAG TPA: hypothetical protein VHF22_13905 [Planctomycetota bacterium]|nr:hypothetical protein [Planctomycetota bacterium]